MLVLVLVTNAAGLLIRRGNLLMVKALDDKLKFIEHEKARHVFTQRALSFTSSQSN